MMKRSQWLILALLVGFNFSGNSDCKAEPTPESSAPSTGIFLLVAPQTLRSDEVTLYWDKPDQISGAVSYQVFCGGKSVGTTKKTYLTVKSLDPQHSYSFILKVQSASGEVLSSSNAVNVQTLAKEKVISVEDYGAKGDGVTLNTKAIQAAISACPSNGVVLIPKGTFLSGALFLKSDMTLQIDAGGILQGSTMIQDYEPLIHTRFEGIERDCFASLLNAGTLDHAGPANVQNLSIRGEGEISGGGEILAKAMIAAKGMRSRDRLLCLTNCSGLEIEGLSIKNSPCWTIQYIYCEGVCCHDLKIASTVGNGDGMDPDSARNVYIFNCSFSTGDDCIAVKSGKNPEGNVINRPTEHVRIEDCTFTKGHGISIGSEMSGGIRDVVIQDCVARALQHGLQIKASKDRGNVVENVTVRDCELESVTILTAYSYNNDGAPAPLPPYFRDFHFFNLDLSKAKPSSVVMTINGFAMDGHRTKNVTFENVKLPRGAIIQIDQTEDLQFSNVMTIDGQKPTYEVTNSDRVVY